MATSKTTAAAPVVQPGTPPKGLMKVANRIIAPLLRSPLHGLISGSLMLLTMTGRKSGRRITTPVSYLPDGAGRLILFTFSSWWPNLQGGAPVTLRIQGRDVRALATPDSDPATVAGEIGRFLHTHGVQNARKIGLRLDPQHPPTPDDLHRLAAGRVVIHITLAP